ncbi:hypothetical protein [Halobacterium jilantaiense]|uniref:hypothetical protein n=1 Tax=Halobacterium jilantaiense TaxID=355548 RepID=UPI00116009D9|nr:hypothetical protein [Halobacterium jilantaiense]
MNAQNATRYRSVRVTSYILADCVLFVTALVSGLLNGVPLPNVAPIPVQVDLSIVAFVVLPIALTLSAIARAATRAPTDIVLGALAVPCLLAGLFALYQHVLATPGIYWGGLLTLVAGTILAFAVLADAVIEYLVTT